MTRLRTPTPTLLLANTIVAIFAASILFTAWHIAGLEDEHIEIQKALDARAAAADGAGVVETPLQRAARDVCNDHPQRAGRTFEPRWTPDGQLECLVVTAQESAR
jgi:hypothetical protein